MASEFDLIARYFARANRADPDLVLGVGDDAALVRATAGATLAISTDMLVEGRHFLRGCDAHALGHKALAVNLSDLAAMGAKPRWALLAVALPGADSAWLDAFCAGLFALANRFDVALIGGDTTRAPDGGPLTLCLTAIGAVSEGRALRRDGARPGDDVWVSGALGAAALALDAMRGDVRLDAAALAAVRERLDRPEPRVVLGERLGVIASAAIDVSDGFGADLGHLLERSGVGATIELERVPAHPAVAALDDPARRTRYILAGGDDYELVFTAAATRRDTIVALATELGIALTCVGAIRDAPDALRVLDAQGRALTVPSGFDHFAEPAA